MAGVLAASMVFAVNVADAATEHIRIVDREFVPRVLRGLSTNPLNPASQRPIVWQNRDDVAHRVNEDPDQAGIRLRTTLIPPGEDSDARRVKFAATWKYICSVHPTTMSGRIRVRPALYERDDPGNYAVVTGPTGVTILRLANASIPSLYSFEVQRQKDGGDWVTVREGLRVRRLELSPNDTAKYRYRVRIVHEAGTMTGWSPPSKTLTVA